MVTRGHAIDFAGVVLDAGTTAVAAAAVLGMCSTVCDVFFSRFGAPYSNPSCFSLFFWLIICYGYTCSTVMLHHPSLTSLALSG